MPLPRWLQSLLPGKPPQPPEPYDPTTYTPSPAYLDQSHRIHIAANDPAFPAKREAAVARICQAITDIAAPMGYTCKGTTWSREAKRGKSAIHLQRSRYGFTAYINLRFLTSDGQSLKHGVWAQDDDIRIQRFYLPSEGIGLEDGVLTYLDVYENPACLDEPMHILATRALPWLDAHHRKMLSPNIADFLPN